MKRLFLYAVLFLCIIGNSFSQSDRIVNFDWFANSASSPQPSIIIDWGITAITPDISPQGVAYGNGVYVAVGSQGTGNRVMSSTDGVTWTSRTSAADNSWNDVCFGNNLFVAVAGTGTGNRVMTSPDGVTWTIRTSAADNVWNSICFGNNLYVAVASSGTNNRVMTSPDGTTWTTRTSAGNIPWNCIAYGNGVYAAVASGVATNHVMRSTDGVTWTGIALAGAWDGIVYGGTTFVAVQQSSSQGGCATSSDASSWTLRTQSVAGQWRRVAFGSGFFAAMGNSIKGSQIMTSPDGVTWTTRVTPLPQVAYRNITYGNSKFVCITNTTSGLSSNYIVISPEFDQHVSFSEPTVQASNINVVTAADVDNPGLVIADVSFTSGNSTSNQRVVIVKESSAVDGLPVDGQTYTGDNNFGGGSELPIVFGGNFVVNVGSSNSFQIGNLTEGLTYHIRVFEFNGLGGLENYLTSSGTNNPISFVANP